MRFSKIFPLLCLFVALVGKTAHAQKSVDAYGFRFEVPNTWELDWDIEPNTLYVTEPSNDPLFYVHYYDSTQIRNEKDLRAKIMRGILHNNGGAYQHTTKVLWQSTKYKDLVHNDIPLRQYITITPPDEDGDSHWQCVWTVYDSTSRSYVFFEGASWREPKHPETNREKELNAIFQTIRRFTKTVQYEDRALKQGESIDFTIPFVADDTAFEGDGRADVRKIANFLKANPNIDVSIVGYASKMNAENRLTLGKARAEKVRDLLLKAKIEPKRLACKGSDEGGIDKRVKVIIERIR